MALPLRHLLTPLRPHPPSFLPQVAQPRLLRAYVAGAGPPLPRSRGVRHRSTSSFGYGARHRRASRVSMWAQSAFSHDVLAATVTSAVALALLRFWEELAKRRVFDQATSRKLVHTSVGLAFMLFWPLFGSGSLAPFLAALAPGVNVIRMLLLGLGVWRNDGTVKSMTRHGDNRELLKGPLYYACTITLATSLLWRTSPVAVASICNLCAGDGMADLVGRRFGRRKLPYNPSKSYAGSIAMATSGFLASVWYMYYYSLFGLVEVSLHSILGFLFVSVAASIVESLPISSALDDNLTVPLTSFVVGSLVF